MSENLILHYEMNGFWIYYKRLEDDNFKWPKENNNTVLSIEQFNYLFAGLDINPKGKFTKKSYENI